MKVIFPCKGSIVLTKNNIDVLQSFYKSKLMTSKIYDNFKSSEFMVQVGTFNYIPSNYSLVLKNANFLSIKQLRSILNSDTKEIADEEPIGDDSITSHPFFKTLKPLGE